MYSLGLVDTLVTHANMKGLGPTTLFGDCRGFMPPQLKTKQNKNLIISSNLTTNREMRKMIVAIIIIMSPRPRENPKEA